MKRLNNSGQTVMLDMLSTQELERILNLELRKDPVDEILVYEILCILKEREFPQDCENTEEPIAAEESHRKKSSVGKLPRIVALVAVFCLLITAVPVAMGSENIIELVGRWTQDVFAMFWSDKPTDLDSGYVFRTDHPGLQQIYDAVVEAGITEKVVPMWVPEECELEELRITTTLDGTKVRAVLTGNNQRILLVFEPYTDNPSNSYPKDDMDAIKYDAVGIKHYIVSNDSTWSVAWANQDISCSIVTSYDKKVIYRIIGSIYAEGV